jgi:hypothetical protein
VRAKLTIGPEGQISLPPKEAETLGLAGGGDVELVSGRGTFALVVPARADQAKAFFGGSLAALTVAEVVQFVFSSLKTGALLVAGERRAPAGNGPAQLHRKTVYFRDGQVVFASSSDPADRLGPVLLEHGFVGEADLARCSSLVRGGHPLGQVLEDEGVLTSGQLYEGITLQVKEIFLRAFLETEGHFAFVEGPLDEQNQVKLPERTRDLILQGMKRVEEAEQRRAAERGPPAEQEIVIEVEAPAPAAPRASGPFETYRRIFKHVYGALAAVEADAAERLNSYFDRLADKKRAVFEGVRVAEDGEMDVAQILVNVNASGAYKGAAARARSLEALEEFLAFALFEAKNRLPRADAERLLREVGRMQVGKA